MTFHELEKIIGIEAAVKLVTTLGGVGVYVPVKPSPSNEITAAIGIESAKILAAELGGQRITLPKARAQVRAPVLRLVEEGKLSQRQAALALDLTERQIGNLMSGRRKDERQAKLFDDL